MLNDTIAAISTAMAPAAIGIVRVSGPAAAPISDLLFRPATTGVRLETIPARRLCRGWIITREGQKVDDCLAAVMRAPYSYTGEDTVEFYCHGSPVVLRQVLELCMVAGARAAQAGEFTRRAFIHGKLDLLQVEAVGDLLAATSTKAAALAATQLAGALSTRIAAIRDEVVQFLAHVQAALDYPEEVPEVAPELWQERLAALASELGELAATAQQGMRLRDGLSAVLVGRPNVGKSSLMNLLLATDRAIVAEMPGTTRDVIEESVEIGGVQFRLSDTAGVRRQGQAVEMMGIARTKERVADADLLLAVFDGAASFTDDDEDVRALVGGRPRIAVVNKSDLPQRLPARALAGMRVVLVSALTGQGLAELRQAMVEVAGVVGTAGPADGGASRSSVMVTRPRQLGALRGAQESLQRALAAMRQGVTADCLALELEDALWHLGELTGETAREEVINEIFSRFCVGK